MSFQVNGQTIIDASRNFQSGAFAKTVNGNNVVGTGDIKYIRAGASSNHVVGDYLLTCYAMPDVDATNGKQCTFANFAGGNTFSGAYFGYGSDTSNITQPLYTYVRAALWTGTSVSGTWRLCNYGIEIKDASVSPTVAQDEYSCTAFFARIS